MPARRAHLSPKLFEFHVKNPTGRIAPSSSNDPSTRQYVTGRFPAAGMTSFELEPEFAITELRRIAAHLPQRLLKNRSMRNDVSHLLFNLLWNGFAACASITRPCGTLLQRAAGCLGKCKSSILSGLSQGNQEDGGSLARNTKATV